MNSGDKNWFSAKELAKLGAARVISFPRTEKNSREKARKLNWNQRYVECQGGKDGYMSVFMPPIEILKAIHEFLDKNSDFFEKKQAPSKEYAGRKSKPLIAVGDKSNKYEVNESIQKSHTLADFVFVPKYDVWASAGHGSMIHSEQIVDHLAFKKAWVKSELGCCEKSLALITVKGDSMEPTLSSQDLILIDLRKNQITDNAVYVLQYDGSLLVKRIQRLMNGTVIIKSDNPEYKIEELNAEQAKQLNVLGMVVWYGRKM